MPASPFQPVYNATKHKVFQDSFDAKECYSEEFILVPLTILGIATMVPAVVGYEGSTVVVVFKHHVY
ncbi:MAG: hypothetical protein H0V30_15875 [Chitinophagaceae bacterium]|jgi:cation transport ATPase|nr:hypothetical protein [Chitinophagaceae bacterium]